MFGALKKALRKVSKTVGKIPVVGAGARAVVDLHTAPLKIAVNVASGDRIDRVALDALKTQVRIVRDLAPYAQTVVSFVPGVGTGVGAALGAGLALADGKPLSQAVVAGIRSSLPGGPLAQAAFDVSRAVVAGQPVSAIALQALPLNPEQKKLVQVGLTAARDLAQGRRVDETIFQRSQALLPPDAQKALRIGIAVAQGERLQLLRKPAAQLVVAAGVLESAKSSNPVVKQQARDAIVQTVKRAQQGDARARVAVNHLLAAKRLDAQKGNAPVRVGSFLLFKNGTVRLAVGDHRAVH